MLKGKAEGEKARNHAANFLVRVNNLIFVENYQSMSATVAASLANSVPDAKPATGKRRGRKVPGYLVREVINGIPFYYRGYKDVLSKKKTFEEIMADSGLQGFIKKYFYDLLARQLDASLYEVYMGELGAHLSHKNNLGLDVAVFDLASILGDKLNFNYLDVVPKLVIEIDMKVSLDDTGLDTFAEFLSLKTQKLFDFGTERLLWVISRSKKIVVAEPGEDWAIVDWNKDIEVWQGIPANIGRHLKARGVNPDIIF